MWALAVPAINHLYKQNQIIIDQLRHHALGFVSVRLG